MPLLTNSLVVTRGNLGDKRSAVWDAVGICTGNEENEEDRCPLHLDCPYLVVTNPGLMNLPSGGRVDPDKCALQARYLDYLYKSLVIDNCANLNQQQVDSVGLHIIPLYGHLIKFKMIEYSLSQSKIVYTTPKGMISTHPIYKEIRETLKNIAVHWKATGLYGTLVLPGTPSIDDLMMNGDPNYYDSLCEPPPPEPLKVKSKRGGGVDNYTQKKLRPAKQIHTEILVKVNKRRRIKFKKDKEEAQKRALEEAEAELTDYDRAYREQITNGEKIDKDEKFIQKRVEQLTTKYEGTQTQRQQQINTNVQRRRWTDIHIRRNT